MDIVNSTLFGQQRAVGVGFHNIGSGLLRASHEATVRKVQRHTSGIRPLVVPYINVPETETYVQQELDADVWGLPGKMTHILKNKASFYQLVDEAGLPGFQTPDYRF